MKAHLLLAAALSVSTLTHTQGPLTPPAFSGEQVGPIPPVDVSGNPQASMETLHQIEPGTDVASLPSPTITAPGRYILSRDVAIIRIEASNVTLDLSGFRAIGITFANPTDPPAAVSGVIIWNGTVGEAGSTPSTAQV